MFSLDQGGVTRCRRLIAVDLRTGQSRQSGDIEQILDRERHAGQRPQRFALFARPVDQFRAKERALLGDRREGIKHRIALADARQRRLDHANRAGAARRYGSGNIGGSGEVEIGRGRIKHETLQA